MYVIVDQIGNGIKKGGRTSKLLGAKDTGWEILLVVLKVRVTNYCVHGSVGPGYEYLRLSLSLSLCTSLPLKGDMGKY